MSTNFLPPPPTNETLVVDEFKSHIRTERAERRRDAPRRLLRNALLVLPLVILFALCVWMGSYVVDAVGLHITKSREAAKR